MRKLSLVLTLLLVLCIGGVATAQETQQFCGNLSQEDCDLYYGASTNFPSSAGFDATVTLSLTNLPDMPQDTTININLSGEYTGLSPELMGTEMMSMNMTDLSNIDFAALFTQLAGGLRNFDGALRINVTIPPELAGGATGMVPGAGAFDGNLALELRLVDGFGYINFDTLQALVGESGLTGWGGIDLAGALDQVIASGALEQLNTDMALQASGIDPTLLQTFTDPQFIGQFTTLERLEDQDGAAVFQTNIDFAGLFADPAFQDYLRSTIEAQGEAVDDAQFQQITDALNSAAAGATLIQTTRVDPATGYLQYSDFTFTFDASILLTTMGTTADMSGMNMGEATAEAGAAEATADAQTQQLLENPPVITVTGAINYRDVDAVAEITSPEGAQIVPLEALFGGMMGQGGMGGTDANTTPQAPEATATPAG
ncbi:MAG: hypothetical protein SF029_06705 [bacterium]|nr:hypothetical protein [bacterium]